MPSDAAYYREHAEHCRKLAEGAREQSTITILLQMADDFDAEAARIDTIDISEVGKTTEE